MHSAAAMIRRSVIFSSLLAASGCGGGGHSPWLPRGSLRQALTFDHAGEKFVDFTFVNTTSEGLRVPIVQPDCACNSVRFLPTTLIGPGSTGVLRIGITVPEIGITSGAARLRWPDNPSCPVIIGWEARVGEHSGLSLWPSECERRALVWARDLTVSFSMSASGSESAVEPVSQLQVRNGDLLEVSEIQFSRGSRNRGTFRLRLRPGVVLGDFEVLSSLEFMVNGDELGHIRFL